MNYLEITKKFNLDNNISKILVERGIDSEDKLIDFLNPSLDKLQPYHDIPNLDNVIRLIKEHILQGTIVIFCDFDCDGLTSAAILYKAIKKYDSGANLKILNGDRYRDEYGLSEKAVEIIKNELKPSLVITLDCGISNQEEIKELKDNDIEVIVIDHHENNNPESIKVFENKFIDLKVKNGNYQFKEYSGGGITWRVAQALLGEPFLEVLDLVTLSTVADVVPLVGENRYIVAAGLDKFRSGDINPGLEKLISFLALSSEAITAADLGYQIGPALNATGRLGSPEPVLDLLLYDERRPAQDLNQLAHQLISNNEKRKELTARIMEIVDEKIKPELNVILVKGKILRGLVGLIAGKLSSKYNKPAIVIDSQSLKGSARSIEPFDIYKSLKKCQQEGLLEKTGGHKLAAGIKLKAGRFRDFFERMNQLAEGIQYQEDLFDLKLDINKIDSNFLDSLYRLAPFGHKNRHPIFLSENVRIDNPDLINDSHLKFYSNDIESIAFYMADKFERVKPGSADLLYRPEWTTFRGKTYLNLIVKDIL
ncbi:MAG: single-stranded-DNA-specific exonuclease RecJ [Bacillota bacterium]